MVGYLVALCGYRFFVCWMLGLVHCAALSRLAACVPVGGL